MLCTYTWVPPEASGCRTLWSWSYKQLVSFWALGPWVPGHETWCRKEQWALLTTEPFPSPCYLLLYFLFYAEKNKHTGLVGGLVVNCLTPKSHNLSWIPGAKQKQMERGTNLSPGTPAFTQILWKGTPMHDSKTWSRFWKIKTKLFSSWYPVFYLGKLISNDIFQMCAFTEFNIRDWMAKQKWKAIS